ncbi:Na/Pi cotransporter family protein [Butyricicoccus sp.]|uniref:Na/Pi cotransporter family protein n=1 Tax=Butyricicoccus sp. TaxID=2049021 RepID=UPI0037367E77
MNSEMVTTITGLLGGLAVFIYGMNLMSEGLQKAAGEKMKKVLSILTKNPVVGMLAGALVTAVLQSSSATTVMAIGFVSAGLMTLPQAISVIFGANIGTTMTAQIIAFKIDDFIWPIVFIGFVLYFFPKKESIKNIGQSIFAFGLLFVGITTMSNVMKPLADSPVFLSMIERVADIPILGVCVGALMTLVVQSSSATIAVLQNFASQPMADGVTSILGLTGAIPILLGDNIGTTITALLASVGQSKNAKRTAAAHCVFNVTGTVVFMCFIPWYAKFIQFISPKGPEIEVISRQIANAHTFFNITNTIIWLPLIPLMVKIVMKLIPEGKQQAAEQPLYLTKFLDTNVLKQPEAAMRLAVLELTRITEYVTEMAGHAKKAFLNGDKEAMSAVDDLEDVVDILQDSITNYLSSLCKTGKLTQGQSQRVAGMIRAASDIERIGDQYTSITNFAKLKREKEYTFTEEAMGELEEGFNHVQEMLRLTIRSLHDSDPETARQVVHQQESVEDLERRLSRRHMERLNLGSCSPENTVAFTDVLHDLECIGEYCSDIAEMLLDDKDSAVKMEKIDQRMNEA